MEKEYIQLPALKRDLDPDVVKALWAFIQLPEEYQARYQEQYELLNQRKEEADRQLQENIEKIDADAIHLYEETMRSMIRDIVQQSCNLACWVRYHKYDLEESLEEMIDQQPHAAKYIIAMNILMDDAEGSESPFEGNSFMTSSLRKSQSIVSCQITSLSGRTIFLTFTVLKIISKIFSKRFLTKSPPFVFRN